MKAATTAIACLAALTQPAVARDVQAGAEAFYSYCAACHGDDATGGGPMTEILNADPPDLTALAANNEGVFPSARIVFRIDGRDPTLAHGGPMPIFGDIFGDDLVPFRSEFGQPILAGRGIVDIVAWLETLQQP